MRIIKNCEYCQKPIDHKRNIFCNKECYLKWNASFKSKMTCTICFKEYCVPNCRENKSTACSKDCRAIIAGKAAKIVHKSKNKNVDIVCLQCSIIFTLQLSKATWSKNGITGRRKFCCKACQLQYRKDNSTEQILTCRQCTKQYKVAAHIIGSKYCSNQCKWDFEKTLTGEKSPHFKHGFKIYRREALKLFEYKCANCQKKHRRLHVHHIDGDNKNNKPTNWSILCEKCHRLVHFGLLAWPPSAVVPVAGLTVDVVYQD